MYCGTFSFCITARVQFFVGAAVGPRCCAKVANGMLCIRWKQRFVMFRVFHTAYSFLLLLLSLPCTDEGSCDFFFLYNLFHAVVCSLLHCSIMAGSGRNWRRQFEVCLSYKAALMSCGFSPPVENCDELM